LESGGIFKHLLRVSVPVLIKFSLVLFLKALDLLLSNIFSIALVLHQRIETIPVLES
jgi:hypothetical protein